MKAASSFLKQNSLPVFAGVLTGTSYIPFPPWALLFALTPLWIHILTRCRTWKEAAWAGWLAQFVLTLIGFHWVAPTAQEFGYLPWPAAIMALLLFATTVHLYIPLAAGLGFALHKQLKLSATTTLLITITLVSAGEHYWPSLFPWNLGYPWYASGFMLAQSADHIGFLGLSWLTHLAAAVAALVWLRRSKAFAFATALAVLFAFFGLTWFGDSQRLAWMATDSTIRLL